MKILDDVFLLPKQVADRLAVPLSTLRYWRAKGDGPDWFVVGSRIRYLVSDLDVWLEGQRGQR